MRTLDICRGVVRLGVAISLFVTVSSLPVLAQSSAINPISISPMPGGAIIKTATVNLAGTCGDTTIVINGITSMTGDFFQMDPTAGSLLIRKRLFNGPALTYTPASQSTVLSDLNGLKCTTDNAGKPVLLVWSNCDGNACWHGFNFSIIRISDLALETPMTPQGSTCDAGCADKILGTDLGHQINVQAGFKQ